MNETLKVKCWNCMDEERFERILLSVMDIKLFSYTCSKCGRPLIVKFDKDYTKSEMQFKIAHLNGHSGFEEQITISVEGHLYDALKIKSVFEHIRMLGSVKRCIEADVKIICVYSEFIEPKYEFYALIKQR